MAGNSRVGCGTFKLKINVGPTTSASEEVSSSSPLDALNGIKVNCLRKALQFVFEKSDVFIRHIEKEALDVQIEIWATSTEAQDDLQSRYNSGKLLKDVNNEIKQSGIQFYSVEQVEKFKIKHMSNKELDEERNAGNKGFDLFMYHLKGNVGLKHETFSKIPFDKGNEKAFNSCLNEEIRQQKEEERKAGSWVKEEERKDESWRKEEERKQQDEVRKQKEEERKQKEEERTQREEERKQHSWQQEEKRRNELHKIKINKQRENNELEKQEKDLKMEILHLEALKLKKEAESRCLIL